MSMNANPRTRLALPFGLILLSLYVIGCASAEDKARQAARTTAMGRLAEIRPYADSLQHVDSVRADALAKAEKELPTITYTRLHIADGAMLDSIQERFSYGDSKSAAYKAFVTLNRRVFGSVRVGDTVVVPDTVVEDMRAYSVFPPLWFGADTIRKIIVISNAYQAYACYEKGKLVRFAGCNTGTESKPTFPGRYSVNWRERLRTSSINENWKLPFNVNFHLYAGNAFHQYYMPGRPASHSCVRQFMDDAEWLFNWVEDGKRNESGRVIAMTGTPVIILDMFDYGREKFGPWLEVANNRSYMVDLPEYPMEIEEALIPISQIPPTVRGGLPNRARYEAAEDTLRARGVIRPEAKLAWSIEYPKKADKAKAAAVKKKRSTSRAAASTPAAPATTEPASSPAGATE